MILLTIIASIYFILIAAYFFKRNIEEIIPLFFCVIIIILYILGFLKALSFINILLIGLMIISIIGICWYLKKRQISNKDIKEFFSNQVFTVGSIVALITVFAIICLERDRIVSAFDEFNYWAVAIKSLWASNGFVEGKFSCTIGGADYPPAVQLFEWWGLNLYGKFDEGIVYIAYFILYFSFFLPFFKNFKKRNILLCCFYTLLLVLFPSIINISGYQYLGVDAILGVIVGNAIYAVIDNKEESIFYYIRIILYLSVLSISKALTGILWSGIILGLFLILQYCNIRSIEKTTRKKYSKRIIRKTIIVSVMTVSLSCATSVLWKIYSMVTNGINNVSNLAGQDIRALLNGTWRFPIETKDYIKTYINVFFTKPLNRNQSILGLSPFFWIVLIIIIYIFLIRKTFLSKNLYKILIPYLVLANLGFMLVHFMVHITIYYGELGQYLIPGNLALSFERYLTPVFLGQIILIFRLSLCPLEKVTNKFNRIGKIICFAAILCLSNYQLVIAYMLPWKYTQIVPEEVKQAEEKSFNKNKNWFEKIEDKKHNRVMYWSLDDVLVARYALVPLSLFIFNVGNISDVSEMQTWIDNNYCTYIYYDTFISEMNQGVAQSMMKNQDELFEVGHLYKIDKTKETYSLIKVY